METGISLHRVLFEEPWELCYRKLEGGSFTGEPEGYVKEGFGDGKLSIKAPLGNLEGDSCTGDFERWMKEGSGNGSSVSVGALWGESGGGAPLLGTLKDMLTKVLEMGACSHRGPVLGKMGNAHFYGLREKGEFFIWRELLSRNSRDI